MLLVVNHYACMALTTVLSQHFCCYVDRFLLGLVFWATISAWLSCSILYRTILILEFLVYSFEQIKYDMI